MGKMSTKISKVREIPRSPAKPMGEVGRSGIELSIIIVDYKSTDFVIKLISDLSKHLLTVRFEVIVVDNDSKSSAAGKIKKAHHNLKNLKIIKAEKNLGFGAGNNLGVKEASGEYLLFLNPDVKVVDDSIVKMLDFLVKHTEIGALTCLLYQPAGAEPACRTDRASAGRRDAKNFQRHFFGRFQTLLTVLLRRQAGKIPIIHDEFFYCDMVTGAVMMIKSEIFQRLGGFDENFFMYIEDEDLCRRLVKADYKNAVLTSARLIHYEGQSSTSLEKKKYYYKSQDYYWQKHYGNFQTAIMKALRYPYILWQKMK